jgi:hypothetical protein
MTYVKPAEDDLAVIPPAGGGQHRAALIVANNIK